MPERYKSIVVVPPTTSPHPSLSEIVALTFTFVVVAGVSVINAALLLMATAEITDVALVTVPFAVTPAPRAIMIEKRQTATHAVQKIIKALSVFPCIHSL